VWGTRRNNHSEIHLSGSGQTGVRSDGFGLDGVGLDGVGSDGVGSDAVGSEGGKLGILVCTVETSSQCWHVVETKQTRRWKI
jgi:hypothetical protein